MYFSVKSVYYFMSEHGICKSCFVCVYRCIGTVIYPGLHTCQFQLLHTASLATRKLYNATIISMQCSYTWRMLKDYKNRVKWIWHSLNNPTIPTWPPALPFNCHWFLVHVKRRIISNKSWYIDVNVMNSMNCITDSWLCRSCTDHIQM